jgi:hypothetical protein
VSWIEGTLCVIGAYDSGDMARFVQAARERAKTGHFAPESTPCRPLRPALTPQGPAVKVPRQNKRQITAPREKFE